MKNRPGLKQYIFAALGVVILVLLDQYTKLLAIAHLKDQSAFVSASYTHLTLPTIA